MSHGSVTDEGVTGSHFVCLIFVFHSTHFVKIISIFGRAVLDILCVLTRYLVLFMQLNHDCSCAWLSKEAKNKKNSENISVHKGEWG